MHSEVDLQQLKALGISPEVVEKQLDTFRTGFPYLQIQKPATVGDGIIRLEEDEADQLVDVYKNFAGTRLKFVPASGAATRMFKLLFEFRTAFAHSGLECLVHHDFRLMKTFFDRIAEQPFYHALYNELWSVGYKMDQLLQNHDYMPIMNSLLDADGLNYGAMPKALLYFHRYGDVARTAFEEHLVEGAQYAKDLQGNLAMHLSVSPEFERQFKTLLERVEPYYESHYDVALNISFSQQKSCTNTLAVNPDNSPFRNADGTLLFRPGGHGALIENLNDLDADLIFIKNIDNVQPDRLKPQTVRYKKALAGLLITYQRMIYEHIRCIVQHDYPADDYLQQVLAFVNDELCFVPPATVQTYRSDKLAQYLLTVLNRPLRVCGMVRNEGEPGGGPFWAHNPDGSLSLQIVESSQVELDRPTVKNIFDSATHFNPVDLVCATKDWTGKPFNLTHFVNPKAGFISTKSKDGKTLKALELPGLWNGAMSNWNTIFVEVPSSTFSPVKTVMDLLRNEHQQNPAV